MFINLSLQNLNAYQNELTNPVAADERACLWDPLYVLKDQNLLRNAPRWLMCDVELLQLMLLSLGGS